MQLAQLSHQMAVYSELYQNLELKNHIVPIVSKSIEKKKVFDNEKKEVVVEKEIEIES